MLTRLFRNPDPADGAPVVAAEPAAAPLPAGAPPIAGTIVAEGTKTERELSLERELKTTSTRLAELEDENRQLKTPPRAARLEDPKGVKTSFLESGTFFD